MKKMLTILYDYSERQVVKNLQAEQRQLIQLIMPVIETMDRDFNYTASERLREIKPKLLVLRDANFVPKDIINHFFRYLFMIHSSALVAENLSEEQLSDLKLL